MLEDCTMDKKSAGRPAQVPCKPGGTDGKKSQDASSSSKSFPKTARKRETPGPNTPKYEQNRKSQSQKGKAFDKRPRNRGQYFSGGKEDSKVEEHKAEIGSVLGNGSKKVSLNHLLNFHYSSKDGGASWHHHGARPGPTSHGSRSWLQSSHRHRYSKEQFLQANCQFVVKEEGDYSKYLKDPDTLVEWDLIEQIRVQSAELLSCPICLYAPTAARMTRCGHVYCWPCMLHYLALADKSSRKCPICFENVHKDDLKSVVALCHKEMSVGEVATMRLMRRERGTLLAVPVQRSGDSKDLPPALANLGSLQDTNNIFRKLLVANTSQVMEILVQEQRELQQRYRDEEGTPEICFTEQALELLGKRQEMLAGRTASPPSSPEVESPTDDQNTEKMPEASVNPQMMYKSAFDDLVEETGAQGTERPRYESISSEGQDSVDSGMAQLISDLETITVEDLETPKMLSTAENLPSKFFYFYQASDGQHMYLHALNARMLEAMYGSLEAAPLELKGRIVEKEAGSMTSELRQRLRYLQHLPVTCQFEVVELDFRAPLISKDVLRFFQDQIEQRRKKRQQRSRIERRREKRITEEENKRMGRFPTPEIKIDSHKHFPEYGNDGSPPSYAHYPEMPGAPREVQGMERAEEIGQVADCGPSFAQMLQTSAWQQRQFNSAPRRQPAPVLPVAQKTDSEPDPEGYVPAPSYSQSFGDAFAQALERATSTTAGTENVTDAGSKKKRKSKQKVLFSTSMACNNK